MPAPVAPARAGTSTASPAARESAPRQPELAPSPGLAAGDGIYQTRPKDTLWSISKRLGPLANRSAEQLMADLFALNPASFANNDPGRLKAGQRLRLPAGVNEPPRREPGGAKAAPQPAGSPVPVGPLTPRRAPAPALPGASSCPRSYTVNALDPPDLLLRV